MLNIALNANRMLFVGLFLIGFVMFGCGAKSNVEFVVSDEDDKIDVYIDDTFFTAYAFDEVYKKPILYPVNTARETSVTRPFLYRELGDRGGHPHQVGLWLTYGYVNGRDFWNVSNAHPPPERYHEFGSIHHREVRNMSTRGNKGVLEVFTEWISLDGIKLLEEESTFVFQGEGNKRIIDRITTLTATEKDLSLKDDKEGMFGMRVRHELNHPDAGNGATGIYRSSEGLQSHNLTGNDVWGTRARWMNLSGNIEGEDVSIIMLDHPDNVGYPTHWHVRGGGLFSANPLGQAALTDGRNRLDFSMRQGESVTFKYRVIIYSDSEVTDEIVESDWQTFVNQ